MTHHRPYCPQTSQISAESACIYPRRSVRYAETFFQEDASGWQTFKYGKLGEVTENIRTFALPFDDHSYTFKMQYQYDSYNRIQRMTYPDGEVVSYGYNRGGMLESVLGNKNGVSSDYIKEIRYNKYELKDSVSYGNGTSVRYLYDSLLRLSHLRSECADGVMQDIDYDYDSVSNITNIANSAPMMPNGLGGTYSQSFSYDNLYRLTGSSGIWAGSDSLDYHTETEYHANGRIKQKQVTAKVLSNGHVSQISYDNGYYYDNLQQPNTLSRISAPEVVIPGISFRKGKDRSSSPVVHFSWDATGNMVSQDPAGDAGRRFLCWDEQNRLQGVVDGKHLSYYLYDANGDRTFKLTGKGDLQNISGTWQYYYLLENATLYASPYLVATYKGYTKHYYAESERIASKIGGGGLTELGIPLCNDDAFIKKMKDNNTMMDKVLVGCLNAKYYEVKPVLQQLYDWQELVAEEEECYWYHPDHLGSSSWITYTDSSAVQHLHYLPWGEDFVNQRITDFSARFTFSAKERDPETGLSYFGSRYYSSDLSIWLSVDPMSAKYASLSPYVYCADNPVRLVDPDGEKFRLIGKNANIAFRNYLLSYKGVDCMNMYDAFSLAESDPNMIMFKDPNVTYKQFSSNYQKVTGIKLKNKDAKKLFEAIKSDCYIEVKLLSKESISPDCMFDELSHELITGEPAYNAKSLSYNPAVEQIMINIYSDNFNAAFNSCIADYGTSDSKFFFNTTGNNTIINPPKGFMLVNAIGKSAKQAQETLIKELLDFYDELK